MKVIKPLLLGFLWRTYKRQGNHLALTGFLAFPFSDPDVPLGEQEMWKSIAPIIPPDSAWDEGMPKDRGEVLLMGDCHAPGGIPISHRQVSLRAGQVAKILDVYGNRFWSRDRGILRKTDPEPFRSMAVTYANAFGGTGYGPNPTGKGFADPSDGSPRPLPNIEEHLSLLASPDDRPEPAGFGPLGFAWTGRYSKVGSYRIDELNGKEPPPLPANADWTLFNQAPPDQWLPGMWSGGEDFSLTGFHPESETQAGRLPLLKVRAFLTLKDGGSAEVPMHPETVWFFPGLSMGVVVHRGSLPTQSDDASEFASVLLACEDIGENRPMDHYMAVRKRREDKKSKDLSRFSDAPLLPGRLADDPRANYFDAGKILQQTLQKAPSSPPRWVSQRLDNTQVSLDRARESFSTLATSPGGSPADSKLEALSQMDSTDQTFKEIREKLENPPASSLPDNIDDLRKDKLEELQKKMADVEAIKRQAAEKIEAALDKLPPAVLERMGKIREEVLGKMSFLKNPSQSPSQMQAPPKKTPSIEELLNKDRILNSLRASRDKAAAALPKGNPPSPETLKKLEDMELSIQSLVDKLDRMKDKIPPSSMGGFTRILHNYAPPDPDSARASELRQNVLDEITRGGTFKDRDLRGVDLSGLNLSGVNFSEADLIGADFSGSNLSDTRFAGAWVAHANFSGCTLDKTDFSGAGMGYANLTGARGTGMSFRESSLTCALLIDAVLSDGDFSKADLFHTVFRRSNILRGSFSQARFLRVGPTPFPPPGSLPPSEEPIPRFPVEETDFSGSDFTKAVFIKVDFLRSIFSGCCLDKATLLECSGPGTRFDGASLKKAAFPKSTDFKHSTFLKADLSGANLRGLDLEGSDFREARLVGMDGSEGILRTTNLSGTTAQKSLFQKSDLRFANGQGGDFSRALFLKADLRGANFSHSSLYSAAFTGAQIDATTLWDHALTAKTILSQERPL